MKSIRFIIVFLAVAVPSFLQAQAYYNVLGFGAKNDSSKLETAAISKAIAAAVKAGGGTVYFPAGKYRASV